MSKKLGLSMMLAAVAAAGCGTDLGECKSPEGLYPYTGDDSTPIEARVYEDYEWRGQKLVDETCAGGRCHSAGAKGVARQGAPAGLDFDAPMMGTSPDVVPRAAQGIANIREHADIIWEAVDEGTMPPSDPNPDREAVRNWLACGAPAKPPRVEVPTGADYTSVYDSLSAGCASCHNDAAPMGSFSLGANACDSHAKVVGQPAAGTCAGGTLVVPGEPENSVLLKKMTASPGCGAPMPLATNGYETTNAAVFNAVRNWILAGAPRPDGCP